ncbi:hypothetical protein THAOC_00768 [Thalassiosira oceanica]|uniref:Uncharacterized protein n=1 Tax=Thalassiosira oceanica TaxID=159749 RepID=K0TNS2_THAOC|nr:hypothetical protein THAOC_00768 [Thalassiosira oceanica]|eukprot:EJK77406.1 hypothetical protein THAOC_00768 [Thalassiosira oceanica]
MSSAVDTDRLCAGGFWIELGNAVNIGVIDGDGGASKKAFKDRAQLNESIHVEHGRNTKVPLFNKFEFVYYSAPGSRATASLSLTLARWCKLCAKLGSEIGWTSLDQRSRADFEEYTGVAANPDNIRLALSKGVLTTTETLRAILEKEQRERMEKEEIEKCTTCTKGCDHKRLPKAINMPYLDQIGIIRGEDGIFRSSKCGSEDVRNGRCKNCRNKKSNLRESQWTKLMEPPAPDGPIKSDDGLAVAELKGQVRQRIEVLNKQGKMNEIATDPILNDAAILLSH